MNFCSSCGGEVVLRIPDNDTRERHVCCDCDAIHYKNPRIVVGTLPVWKDKVLLCRRAIDPQAGFWTLPAGFMENGETTIEGACRETWEEAQTEVKNVSLYSVFDVSYLNQVYMIFRASMTNPHFQAGIESLEVRLFSESEIPWEDLAFPFVYECLRTFFDDRRKKAYPLHWEAMELDSWKKMPRSEEGSRFFLS